MELHLLLHLDVVAIEKGALRSPSTKVANFTYFTKQPNYISLVSNHDY